MSKILLVDDDPSIRDVVRFALEKDGYGVIEAGNGVEALSAFAAKNPDLIILDIMMPEMDGTEVCRRIRQDSRVPIVFLSSRDDEIDRVLGLELGGDDYVTKPFSPRELIARARALLRRSTPAFARDRIECGPISIDLIQHRATRDGEALPLSPTEYRLLTHLVQSPGQVFGREQLLNRVWGYDKEIDQRTVDVHIRRLRKVLNKGGKPDLIRTVREYGYAFDDENAAAA